MGMGNNCPATPPPGGSSSKPQDKAAPIPIGAGLRAHGHDLTELYREGKLTAAGLGARIFRASAARATLAVFPTFVISTVVSRQDRGHSR